MTEPATVHIPLPSGFAPIPPPPPPASSYGEELPTLPRPAPRPEGWQRVSRFWEQTSRESKILLFINLLAVLSQVINQCYNLMQESLVDCHNC